MTLAAPQPQAVTLKVAATQPAPVAQPITLTVAAAAAPAQAPAVVVQLVRAGPYGRFIGAIGERLATWGWDRVPPQQRQALMYAPVQP